MKRLALAAATLALALAAAAPALASDFFPPSPVPSTRDNPKTAATATTTRTDKAAKNQTREFILNKKIVKTTKPTGGETTPSAKTPGAL